MGNCCSGGADDSYPSQPMAGGAVVGREQGSAVTRDEARQRAAAAAEARAQQANTRGQQGAQSKIKKSSSAARTNDGRPDLADARTWD